MKGHFTRLKKEVLAYCKKEAFDLLEMKQGGEKITFFTAYDYSTAAFGEEVGIDMILCGDSVGIAVYGYPGTLPVTMEQMIYHTEAVRRGAPNTFLIGDMPFLTYQIKEVNRFRSY